MKKSSASRSQLVTAVVCLTLRFDGNVTLPILAFGARRHEKNKNSYSITCYLPMSAWKCLWLGSQTAKQNKNYPPAHGQGGKCLLVLGPDGNEHFFIYKKYLPAHVSVEMPSAWRQTAKQNKTKKLPTCPCPGWKMPFLAWSQTVINNFILQKLRTCPCQRGKDRCCTACSRDRGRS